MCHLNPIIALLDPYCESCQDLLNIDHTLAALRRSSVLVTAVLASAAHFFRPDLHFPLLQHSRTLIDRGLVAGTTDLGFVQSLMVATYFKVSRVCSGLSRLLPIHRLGGRLELPFASHISWACTLSDLSRSPVTIRRLELYSQVHYLRFNSLSG